MKRLPLIALFVVLLSGLAIAQSNTRNTTSNQSGRTIFRPTKAQIIQVQEMFKTSGEYDGEASGRLNPATRAAIRKFQNANELRATGTLNRATLERMGIELTENQKQIPVSENSFANTSAASTESKSSKTTGSKTTNESTPKRAPIFRANKEQIIEAQKVLVRAGFYTGAETGRLDNSTRAGLRKYQKENGLKVTGTLNAVTLQNMGVELTERQKEIVAASQ